MKLTENLTVMQAVAKEMNDVMGLTEPIPVEGDLKEVTVGIITNAIDWRDSDGDNFSVRTKRVLMELEPDLNETLPEYMKTDSLADEEKEPAEVAAKTEEPPKKLKKVKSEIIRPTAEEAKKDKELAEEEEARKDKEAELPPKKTKKAAAAKTPTKDTSPKETKPAKESTEQRTKGHPGVIATIIAMLKDGPISRADMLKELVVKFPGRPEKGLDHTLYSQIYTPPKDKKDWSRVRAAGHVIFEKNGKYLIK